MSEYTCIDSFCGAGGLGLGLKQAGFDIRLSFDIDDTCNLKYILRFIKNDLNEKDSKEDEV